MAICYKTAIGKAVEEKQDVGNRVATIKMLAEPNPLLIVATYMPCRGTKTSESDCIETLDGISEVVLAGDLNAALLKDVPNSRDKKLLSFINVHSFNNVGHLRKVDTYHHHSGSCSTQIDYILQNHNDVITKYVTFQREAENCSTHDPVRAIVPVVLDFKTEEDDLYTITHRINWDKVDISRYENTVTKNLSILNANDYKPSTTNINMLTYDMCRSLGDAAKECYPVKRKRGKRKKKRIWSEHIKDLSQFSKKQF